MRTSQLFFNTLKEAPSDAEVISQKLMLRAGFIKRAASGIYTWMPLGLRVLRKVENIVREEMNKAGAQELLMPAVQPAELWQESGRWEKYGPELLRFKDRHQREFVIGPTHEEVITDVVRRDVKSYRQLPIHLYQIQTKFRDEIRPRFGVMRGREFLMKDGYSFHTSFEDLQREYNKMYSTYCNIFTRLGLKFRAVAADTGSIGGEGSHEFHVLAESGEDDIAFCPTSDYAANVELAEGVMPSTQRAGATAEMTKAHTPNVSSCTEVAAFLKVSTQQIVKSLAIVAEGSDDEKRFALILLRADHELNEIKTSKLEGFADFRFASDAEVQDFLGCKPGFIGPVGVDRNKVQVFADRAVSVMANFICGANEPDHHLVNANFGRDLPEVTIADVRNVIPGDSSPDGKGTLEICRGIEVGHIFQLRTKYAEALNCAYLDEQGKTQIMEMGCYGIGVSRIVGAAIEQGNDEKGIILPASIAPFAISIVPMGYHKNENIKAAADLLYAELKTQGIDVVLDDRNERPGVMFADMELIGIPHRIVIGDRGLKEGMVEYKGRQDAEATMLPLEEIVSIMQAKLCDA